MSVDDWDKQLKSTLSKNSLLEQVEVTTAVFLEKKRKSLFKTSRYNANPNSRAQGKRYWRKLKGKYARPEKNKGHRRKFIKNISALIFKNKPDIVRDTLVPKYNRNYLEMPKRLREGSTDEVVFKDFSFAQNPNGVFDQLSELCVKASQNAELNIDFMDVLCDDITPYIILAHILDSLPPINTGGIITKEVRTVIEAVGLRRALKIGEVRQSKASSRTTRQKFHSIKAFPIVKRAPPEVFRDEERQLRPQFKEYVADAFCDTMNAWLRDEGLELTEEAEGSFTRAIGEALDNAERHGDNTADDREGDWTIAGFARLVRKDGNVLLRCSVGIVSTGSTISESLSTAGPTVRRRIEDYESRHGSVLKSGLDNDLLRTVMSVQDGVTRVEEASKGKRGGVGLMELAEVFAELGDNPRDDDDSTFTIVSGNSCIRFTKPYVRGEQNSHGLRELWFNEEKDSNNPPSGDHAYKLKYEFPGVILSASFTIDPDYLRQKIDRTDGRPTESD